MAPLPAPAEKPSQRVSDSQSHAKVRPPTQVAVFCAALRLNLQPALTRRSTIVDELGYVPLSHTGSELLSDVFSWRYENRATIVTSNLSFQNWTSVFASVRLTGALLDRITHRG